MPCVEVSLPVAAPREAIYHILKDMNKYPEFMKDLVSVTVLEREGNQTITHWISNVDGRIIQWTERDIFDDEQMQITYYQTAGDLRKMEGSWVLTPVAEGTEVKLIVDFDFGIPMISGLLHPILKKKVRTNSENMLQAIKQRLEQTDAF